MLADGFDIHHVDMNHENNERGNIVLIESTDHKTLHGGNLKREDKAAKSAANLTEERKRKGKLIYEAKVDGVSWRAAAIASGLSVNRYSDATIYKRLADAYALHAGLPLHVHRPSKTKAVF